MANYLLEIGLEELPARFLKSLSQQFVDLTESFLKENRLEYSVVEKFATPRRLAVRVKDLSDYQKDVEEIVKGPSLKIAKDSEGNWSKAALGFIKGQKADENDIFVDQIKGEDYIFVNKKIKGKPSAEVLEDMISVINGFNFPVSMRWSDLSTAYIRPIHWMVSLLDDQIIPLEFVNIKAGRTSYGHRFLGKEFKVSHADNYEEELKEQFVIANFEERQALIREQIYELAQDNNWAVPVNLDLLEEVTSIVEWPTTFYGEFESKYLTIPSVISITAMRDHQRYFYVLDDNTRELLPYFISVRNGDNYQIENVIKGNKKVLKARLEDALFFYQEDLNTPLETYLNKLENVNEHFKLGTFADKQVRVGKIIDALDTIIKDISPEVIADAKRASEIYKFDLMTGVVGEFSELQGTMGEIYALEYGEKPSVAKAIGEQYLPTSSGGEVPHTESGAVLALADKLDTLIQYFSVDLIPSGSNDPYGLRRQAAGIVEIIMTYGWSVNLSKLVKTIIELFKLQDHSSLASNVVSFIKARLAQKMTNDGVDHDIVEAISHAESFNLKDIYQGGLFIQGKKYEDASNYKAFVENVSRIMNLGMPVEQEGNIQVDLAQTPSEKQLIDFSLNLHENLNIEELYHKFVNGHQLIISYFENNMVNDQDTQIRDNRLQTMKSLTNYIKRNFDPRKLISKY